MVLRAPLVGCEDHGRIPSLSVTRWDDLPIHQEHSTPLFQHPFPGSFLSPNPIHRWPSLSHCPCSKDRCLTAVCMHKSEADDTQGRRTPCSSPTLAMGHLGDTRGSPPPSFLWKLMGSGIDPYGGLPGCKFQWHCGAMALHRVLSAPGYD